MSHEIRTPMTGVIGMMSLLAGLDSVLACNLFFTPLSVSLSLCHSPFSRITAECRTARVHSLRSTLRQSAAISAERHTGLDKAAREQIESRLQGVLPVDSGQRVAWGDGL